MRELLMSETGATAMVLMVIVIGITLITLGCTIAVQWRKARQTEILAALKKEMIERGIAAHEIQTVIRAGTEPEQVTEPTT